MFAGCGQTDDTDSSANSSEIESATIPDSVDTIAGGAFDGCKILTVTYKGGSYTIYDFDEIYSE